MPGQKFAICEKHSLEFLSNMEPNSISSQEIYIKRPTDANSEISDSIIHEVIASRSGLDNRGEATIKVTTAQWVTVMILCFVNLINYMDRYTVAGKPSVFPHTIFKILQKFIPISQWLYAGIDQVSELEE